MIVAVCVILPQKVTHTVDKHQSYDRPGIALNITYRLHPCKSKYKGSAASDSELRRL